MKKSLIGLFFCLVLVLGFSSTALAAPVNSTEAVTNQNGDFVNINIAEQYCNSVKFNVDCKSEWFTCLVDFGDGVLFCINEGDPPICNTYNGVGEYVASIYLQAADGTKILEKSIDVSVAEMNPFIVKPISFDGKILTIQVNNGTDGNTTIDFGDNSGATTLTKPGIKTIKNHYPKSDVDITYTIVTKTEFPNEDGTWRTPWFTQNLLFFHYNASDPAESKLEIVNTLF